MTSLTSSWGSPATSSRTNTQYTNRLHDREALYRQMPELFEELPEAGAPDKPKLVFFFDEVHLLFDDAHKHLVARIAQAVKLIRGLPGSVKR